MSEAATDAAPRETDLPEMAGSSRRINHHHRISDQETLVVEDEDSTAQHNSSAPDDLYTDREDGDFPQTVIERRPTLTGRPRALSILSAEERPAIGEVRKVTTLSREYDPNLVTWSPHDKENPQYYSNAKKWRLTLIASIITVNCTFVSSAPSTTVTGVVERFQVSETAATLVTSIFLCGYIPGPLIWGPTSELVGRRYLFLISVGAASLFNIGCALSKNFGTLLVCRFFTGVFAASPLTNSGGLIADIWDPVGRGIAMALFSASVFIGPVLGPIVGGFVSQSYLGWRWVYWIQLIYGGACFVLCLFIPETYAPVLLTKKARRLRKEDPEKNSNKYAAHERADWSVHGILERTIERPFKMLMLEPMLLLITIYMSYIYGLLYGTFGVFPIIWEEVRGFNPGQGGLIFIGVGIGTTFGAILQVLLTRHYGELVVKWKGTPPPEYRLRGSMVAAPSLAIGLFWLCWTGAYRSVPWYVPAIATIPLGVGFSLVFISFLTYIVETYLVFAASALTANTMVRSAVGAGFPMFVRQMFDNLGIQWAGTLLGCLALIAVPIPFLFYRYGPAIRDRSVFAPALDLKLKAAWELEKGQAKAKDQNLENNKV